jgi:hypothetical protein
MVRTGSITSSGAHGYLAAPVQHGGEPPAELEVPAPFGLNCPGPAVAAELSVGVDARPEGPPASLGHVTKGELRREQALVCWCSHPSDTLNPRDLLFPGMRNRHPGQAFGRGGCSYHASRSAAASFPWSRGECQ